MQDNAVRNSLFHIKPVFLSLYAYISRIPLTIFLTFWSGGFFGGFGMMALMGLRKANVPFANEFPIWAVFAIPALIALLWIQFISVHQEKRICEQTDYFISEDEVTIIRNWWGRNEKSIYLKDIAEISLVKNFFQQYGHVGSVVLIPKSGSETNKFELKDIPTPDYYYNEIKKLINEVKDNEK